MPAEKAQAREVAQHVYGDPIQAPYQPSGNTPIGYLKRGVRREDILLADGLLERGHAGLLAGYSGIGKSGIAMQMGCCWATGKEAFDLCPPQALGIVMVQHEDSENDLARMSQVVRSLQLDEGLVAKNFWIETLRGEIGSDAISIMRQLLAWRKADLLLINPLSAYHDGVSAKTRTTSISFTANSVVYSMSSKRVLLSSTIKVNPQGISTETITQKTTPFMSSSTTLWAALC